MALDPDYAKDDSNPPKSEKVNHPDHYGGDTTYEAIKVIEAWGLGFHLGNAVKYICRRYRKGDTIKNLEKARWYIDRKIEQLKEKQNENIS